MKQPSEFAALGVAFAFSFALCKATKAATLINNLGLGVSNTVALDTTLVRKATGFKTGGSSASVTGLTVSLLNQDNSSHTLTASIFTDSSGSPGTLVGTFDTSLSVTTSDTVFGPHSAISSGIALAADTAYWLVLALNQDITQNYVRWGVASFVTTDPGTGFTTSSASNLKQSTNSGGTYSNDIAGFGSFELTGAVPEPGKSSLFLLTMAAAVCTRRRT